MVFVLSNKENKTEKEIAEMLKQLGVSVVTESGIFEKTSDFTAFFLHNVTKIVAEQGVVIATDNLKKFKNQCFSKGFIGVCSENNKNALKFFKKNKLSVITCGTGTKNTLSVSSIEDSSMLLCLQRSIANIKGNIIEPCEIKVTFKNHQNLFSLLAVVSALIYYSSSSIEGSINI